MQVLANNLQVHDLSELRRRYYQKIPDSGTVGDAGAWSGGVNSGGEDGMPGFSPGGE